MKKAQNVLEIAIVLGLAVIMATAVHGYFNNQAKNLVNNTKIEKSSANVKAETTGVQGAPKKPADSE